MTTIVDLPDLARGDSRDIRVTITDENGDPIGIAGDLLTITLKLNPEAADPGDLQVKTTVPAGTDADNGIGYINLEASDTAALTPGAKYEYDIQWVQKSASPENVHTLTKGKLPIIQDITQDTT